jgi:hypothetical protein
MSRYLRNLIVVSIGIHLLFLAIGVVYYEYFYVAPEIDDDPATKNVSSGGGSSSGGGGSSAKSGGGEASKSINVVLKELPDDPNAKSPEELDSFAKATNDRQKDLTDKEKIDEVEKSIDAIGLNKKDPEDVKLLAKSGLKLVTGEDISNSDIDRKVSTDPNDHFEAPDGNSKIPRTPEERTKSKELAKQLAKFDHKSSYPHDMVLEDGWYKYIMIDKNGRTLKFKHKKADDMTDQDMNEYKLLKLGKNKNMRLLLNALFEAGLKKNAREEAEKKNAREEAEKKKTREEEESK